MAVRGTRRWLHAKNERKLVVNEGRHEATGGRIFCAWEDCDRDAYDLYKILIDHGRPATPYRVFYAFCSERHRQYFLHSHRSHGMLPPGARNTI